MDSLENITHSLCTLEFARRQAPDGPYYWLLNKLGLYCPQTWEYSRANVTHTVMSKRKLLHLVTEGKRGSVVVLFCLFMLVVVLVCPHTLALVLEQETEMLPVRH